MLIRSRLLSAFALVIMTPATPAQSNRTYDTTCGLCHQKGAVGVPGQFPRLVGRVNQLAAEPPGRAYLIRVVMFGLAGRIDVDGASITGVMPAFQSLADADVATVLNYLARGTKRAKVISAQEVATVRAGPHLSPGQVAALRATLVMPP
jgi:mono/diheme cytochrome c family protein